MVQNFYIACEVCECTIRLRYQVSEIQCPIKFSCPECKTQISGSLQTVWHYGKEDDETMPWHYDMKLNNAKKTNTDKCKYVCELSPDLSTNKIQLDNSDKYILTPYMRQTLNPHGIHNQNTRFYNFFKCWEKDWNNHKVNIDLCYNEKYEVLYPRLSVKYDEFPADINCMISVHHDLINFSFKILPKGVPKEYSKLGSKILKLVSNQKEEFEKITKLYDFDYTKQLERKGLQLIKSFLDMYPKFLPVFNTLKITGYKDLGVSTLSFEDIKSFYQDSYEFILYNVPRIIALNNIRARKNIDSFIVGEYDFKSKIDKYSSKYLIYQELISDNDDFSWLIDNVIENHIRNSIGHFNYEENLIEQTIVFIDEHKGKNHTETKALIEIARDCVYMFYTLMNLLELNYNILKIQTIDKTTQTSN